MADKMNLKPCPFCGGPAEFSYGWDGFGTAACVNTKCGASLFAWVHEAEEKWNKRASNEQSAPSTGGGD